MKGKIFKIKNAEDELVLPITTTEAVYSEDGKTLNDEIKNINSSLDNIEDEKATRQEVDVERKRIDNINASLETNISKTNELNIVKEYQKIYVAHRGLNCLCPENTLISISKAKEFGFSYVELDVKFTSDGYYVIFHDDTIDNLTNGTGKVNDLTLNQLMSYKIDKGVNVDLYDSCRIPTLEETLNLCLKLGMKIFLELKNDFSTEQLNKMVSIIKKYNMVNNIIFISYYYDCLLRLNNIDDTLTISYIMDSITDEILDKAKPFKNTFIFTYKPNLTDEKIEKILSRGYLLGAHVLYQDDYFKYDLDRVTFIVTDYIIGGVRND